MANAHLEFRPNDRTDAVISGGINSGGGLINQTQGPGYAQGLDFWTQARIKSGGFLDKFLILEMMEVRMILHFIST